MAGTRVADTHRTAPDRLSPRRYGSQRDGSGRERVVEFQRVRLLVAMTEVCSEQGVSTATVAHVVTRAGVSRRTFYELFQDGEECLLAALDSAIAQASQRMLAAYDPDAKWEERNRSALIALLLFLDENPHAARLMLIESLAAGPTALERRCHVLARLADAIDEGRSAKASQDPPPLTAEGVVGGVLSVLHSRLASHRPWPLVELVNHLTGMIVLPYRGAVAARAELARDTPAPIAPSVRPIGENPLKELQMRFTYRTVRVLAAIAADPGSSNRRLAENAEIADQGQMSKLLARLEKRGLVENEGAGTTRGEANAWKLTARGRDVQEALAAQD